MKPSTCYFHMKTKILADFQICISLPLKETSFYYAEKWFSVVDIKACKKSSFQLTDKSSSQILKLWKAILYKSNFGNHHIITKTKMMRENCWNHRVLSKFPDVSFSTEFRFEAKTGYFVTRLRTFSHPIRPHIFPTYNDTRFIVKRSPHLHTQRYFCHKPDAH